MPGNADITCNGQRGMMNKGNAVYDVIVVGTGPGGATVAKELALRKKRVLMLEWGEADPVKGTAWQAFKWLGMPGKGFLITHNMLGVVRAVCTGGSSVFFYGTCFETPFDMLEKYGVVIRDEVAEARAELPVAPLKDEMVSPMARRIMDSARSLGYDWRKLDKYMYQDRWRPEYAFGYYGDPHRVRWDARMYVEEALEHGATIVHKAKATRAIINNGKAIGVEYRSGFGAKQAYAENIVIAAGGIGSPLILRNSGIRKAGYDFFFDPLITVCGVVDDMRAQANEIPMTAGLVMEEEGYMMTDMPLPFLLDMAFSAEVFRLDRLFAQQKTLRIMIKARDSLGGYLNDRGGVRKRLTDEDKRRLLRGYERAREILEHAGARGIFKSWYLASHPGGTVKLGDLLDANLQTEYENLYVCDCSVIPEPWGLPPTLTLIGLGKHLARILSGEKKRCG